MLRRTLQNVQQSALNIILIHGKLARLAHAVGFRQLKGDIV